MTGAKRMVNYARDHSTADGLDYIATWNASMLDGDAIRQTFMAQAKGTSRIRGLTLGQKTAVSADLNR